MHVPGELSKRYFSKVTLSLSASLLFNNTMPNDTYENGGVTITRH